MSVHQKYARWGMIFLLTSMVWLYVFAEAILTVMPTNPIKDLTLGMNVKVETWFPQGWGFFSKNPREPQFSVMDIAHEKLAPEWPNNLPVNLFGLKRLGRSQGIEAGLLVSQISDSAKKECSNEALSCLKESETNQQVVNSTPSPTLCGDLGFVFQEPVPWAWSGGRERIEMPSKVVRVNVQCLKR